MQVPINPFNVDAQKEPRGGRGARHRNSGGFKQSSEMKASEPIDLYNCLSEFFKTDTLDRGNELFCQFCQRTCVAQMRFRIKQCRLKFFLSWLCIFISASYPHYTYQKILLDWQQAQKPAQFWRGDPDWCRIHATGRAQIPLDRRAAGSGGQSHLSPVRSYRSRGLLHKAGSLLRLHKESREPQLVPLRRQHGHQDWQRPLSCQTNDTKRIYSFL